ncbi:MAG: TolC family protein [Gemmatimonadetes bacterium]|nr:TolC family protein [Gemmatimonadota bacterium]
MRARMILGWLVVFSLVAAIGYAQEAPVRRLALAEALDIARRNNPDYVATLNNRWPAGRRLMNATADLITPSATISGSTVFVQGGTQNLSGSGFVVENPSSQTQGYSLDFGYRFSGATLANRGLAHAELRATDQDIAGALTVLETQVRQQYLNLLQAQAQALLARRSVERSTENLNLAQARYSVGQGTLIDVRRAEVEKGQAEVNLLRADQGVENQTLVLFQRLGVPAPEPVRVELTDSFPVVEPRFAEDSLMAQALAENPGLRALRSREASARWGVRSANSQYLPALQLSVGYGKYRQTFSGVDTVITGTNPWNLRIGVSLPLYDGFQRNYQTAQARAQEDDARQAIRGRELTVRAEVSAAYRALIAAYRTIALQASNKTASGEALELATQRYRVGSGSYIELLDARLAAERADADYVTAVYDYHKAVAALENAVGRPLR